MLKVAILRGGLYGEKTYGGQLRWQRSAYHVRINVQTVAYCEIRTFAVFRSPRENTFQINVIPVEVQVRVRDKGMGKG